MYEGALKRQRLTDANYHAPDRDKAIVRRLLENHNNDTAVSEDEAERNAAAARAQ